MPIPFTEKQQEDLKEQLFLAGIDLLKEYGMQRMTVDKLTKRCSIAKGSFYLFYASKEEYIYALSNYVNAKAMDEFQKRLNEHSKLTAHEFIDYLYWYLYSDLDLLSNITIDDFNWLEKHLKDYHPFDLGEQTKLAEQLLSFVSDADKNIDTGIVINLIKDIYAMREHRENFKEESIDQTIDILLHTLEMYIIGEYHGKV